MIITTTDHISGGQDYEIIGILEANSTRGASAGRDWLAGFRDFFGGRSGSYKKVLRGLLEDVHKELDEHASEAGADAVIGFRTQLTAIEGSKMVALQGIGTAIKYK